MCPVMAVGVLKKTQGPSPNMDHNTAWYHMFAWRLAEVPK